MAKKATPIITHTEIYARAIRHVEAEIDGWRRLCADLPQEERVKRYREATKELHSKLEALQAMYRFETGVDYE